MDLSLDDVSFAILIELKDDYGPTASPNKVIIFLAATGDNVMTDYRTPLLGYLPILNTQLLALRSVLSCTCSGPWIRV